MPSSKLTEHYSPSDLLERIEAGLRAAGVDPAKPSPDDLKGVDEFHIGGIEATEHLLDPLGLANAIRVLDVGSGIGGTARFVASRYGPHVTGVDLTPEFVATAQALSARCGLTARNEFMVGNVLGMPVASGAYGAAVMIHVGMNIADKRALFREVARALRRGGRFAVFDIMRADPELEIAYPAPWSPDSAHSFVDSPEVYRAAADAAGLTLVHELDRMEYAQGFFRKVMAAAEENGPPHVGLHLIMGDGAKERYGNAVDAVMRGAAGPWEMVFEKPGARA